MSRRPVDPSSLRALRELLLELLTEAELRALLHDLFGRAVASALPSGTTAEVFFAAVDALDRRGLVSEKLFAQLAEHAPGKLERIAEVAAMWRSETEPGVPSTGEVVAALEALYQVLQARELAAAIAHVAERQAVYFPPVYGEAAGAGQTTHRLEARPGDGVLYVESVTTHPWASGTITTNWYALAGLDLELLRARSSDGSGQGWELSDACVEAIDRRVEAFRRWESDDVHVFVGTRAQLGEHTRVAAWSEAKRVHAARGVFLRTTEGFIDFLARRTLGERWYTLVPPGSVLARPFA